LPLSGSGCPRLPPCLSWEMSQCTVKLLVKDTSVDIFNKGEGEA